MGLIKEQIELSNPKDRNINPVVVKCLVDTGSLHLCVPEHIALQLGFEELYERKVTMANGKRHLALYYGADRTKVRKSCLLHRYLGIRRRALAERRPDGRYGYPHIALQISPDRESGESEYRNVNRKMPGLYNRTCGQPMYD